MYMYMSLYLKKCIYIYVYIYILDMMLRAIVSADSHMHKYDGTCICAST